MSPLDEVEEAVSAAFREEWAQIVATLIRVTGDWDLAEECAQDAFAQARERWGGRRGAPPPRAGGGAALRGAARRDRGRRRPRAPRRHRARRRQGPR
ncbi:RNA polymerase sigma factor, partial [Streptomyces sp. NPDC127079]